MWLWGTFLEHKIKYQKQQDKNTPQEVQILHTLLK